MIGLMVFAAMVAAAPVEAAAPQRAATTAFRIVSGDRLVGTPTIVLREGVKASVAVRRPGGYVLDATLTRTTADGRELARIETRVQLEEGGRWIAAASPTIILPPGNTGKVRVVRRDGGLPLELTVAVAAPSG